MSELVVIAALCLAGFGVLMVLLAAVGLLRYPDVYTRSHAAGKAATLGVCCIMLGCALGLGGGAILRALLVVVFLFVTIPVGAQLIVRAALCNGARPASDTRLDPDLHESGSCGLERQFVHRDDKEGHSRFK